ncbi:MAG TPA: hypothetical protein VH592_03755 [Gemmataceae bacterium]|jgi:hypothetical protein
MIRGLMCLTVFLTVAVAACAQESSEGEPIKLTLSPAAAPSPALKYLLLPELIDQTPGNAALEYYRAFSPEWWGNIRQQKTWETIDKALQTPLEKFPRKDLGWLDNNRMLEQVDRAARREFVDWGMGERLRREGYELLLPDVQSLRQISALLAARARLEIAESRFDKALYTLQTGLALAHHVGDGVILIQDLVGMAVAQQTLAQVEELIQRPSSPNLYWALTQLPRPFFDIRKALQGEKLGMYATIPELRSLENTPLTPEQQQRLLQFLGGGMDALSYGRPPNWNNQLVGMFLVARAYPESKQALIAEGRKAEEVEALPTLQVVLIHSLHQYQRLQDDEFKCASLPYWEAQPQMDRATRRFRQARQRLEAIPFIEFLPAIQKVIATAVRTDRRIAVLRCIEAIRIYGASHGAKLPPSLDAIREVPIPIDPMTGKAFVYRVSGERAVLLGPPLSGEQANSPNSLRYELTFRPSK